ncbi:hypothetical protein [Helicobacter pylori]|uniref:hypothetical protein n=1 Tax=Helicobacter pylori TaxID=210 RepID=UPI001EE63BA9|nr:hypothetical protein [Helicobacter pylori]
MLTRKTLFFIVCVDISYPRGVLTSSSFEYSITAMRSCTLKDKVFRASGIKKPAKSKR